MSLSTIISALVFAGSSLFTPIALFVAGDWTDCDDANSQSEAECDPWDSTGPGNYMHPDVTDTDLVQFFFQPTASRAAYYGQPHMTVADDRGWDCDSTSCEIDITGLTEEEDEMLLLPKLVCPSDTLGECPDGDGVNAKPEDIVVCNCSNWSVGAECQSFCCDHGGGHCPFTGC